MKKWQISKPKIVDWYVDFRIPRYHAKERYLVFQNLFFKTMGNLKEHF